MWTTLISDMIKKCDQIETLTNDGYKIIKENEKDDKSFLSDRETHNDCKDNKLHDSYHVIDNFMDDTSAFNSKMNNQVLKRSIPLIKSSHQIDDTNKSM